MTSWTATRRVDFDTQSATMAEWNSVVTIKGTGETVSTMAACGASARTVVRIWIRLSTLSWTDDVRKSQRRNRAALLVSVERDMTKSPVLRSKCAAARPMV